MFDEVRRFVAVYLHNYIDLLNSIANFIDNVRRHRPIIIGRNAGIWNLWNRGFQYSLPVSLAVAWSLSRVVFL